MRKYGIIFLFLLFSNQVAGITLAQCMDHYCNFWERRCEANVGDYCNEKFGSGSICQQMCEIQAPKLDKVVLEDWFDLHKLKDEDEDPFSCVAMMNSYDGSCRYKDVSCQNNYFKQCMPKERENKCEEGYEYLESEGYCIPIRKEEPVEPEKTETIDGTFTGTILDGYGKPMPYMRVIIHWRGKIYKGLTDEEGYYEIGVESFTFRKNTPYTATLVMELDYYRDDKRYFYVADETRGLLPIQIMYEKEIIDEGDTELNVDFSYDVSFLNSRTPDIELPHFTVIYTHTHEALDFFLTELGANIEYKIPIKVVAASQRGTLYDPNTGTIHINGTDTSMDSPDRPDNREYHEYAHHVMYSQYGGWPQDRQLPWTENHNGYINPSTADSFMEGFAEFWALVISYHNDELEPQYYAEMGSLDRNYKMWDWMGYDEEFAIAGVLYDLWDAENEANDTITLTSQQMWEVLKTKRKDFHEYYKKFTSTYPDKKDGIDKIFLLHGVFHDTDPGNSRRDWDEPYIDSNETRGYQTGEFYIDMYRNPTTNNISPIYNSSETIGKATNWHRPQRSKAVKLPNAYLAVAKRGPRFYQINVDYQKGGHQPSESYIVQELGGLIYVNPPPQDAEWTITITPYTYDYVAGKNYVITKQEFTKKYYDESSQGLFDVHDFQFTETGQWRDPKPKKIYNLEPTHTKNHDEEITQVKATPTSNQGQPGKEEGICCIPLLPLLLTLSSSVLTRI